LEEGGEKKTQPLPLKTPLKRSRNKKNWQIKNKIK
jgi:hypothetical protein